MQIKGSWEGILVVPARAFITEAGPYDADFKNYGLSGSFIADLTTAADPIFLGFFAVCGLLNAILFNLGAIRERIDDWRYARRNQTRG